MSKDKSIIFSAEMVRAILNGSKTQDRRAIRWYSSLVRRWVSLDPRWCFEVVKAGR